MRLRMRLMETERKGLRRKPKEYKVLSPEERKAKRASKPRTVRLNMPASLGTARYARTLAAKALGQDQPARWANSNPVVNKPKIILFKCGGDNSLLEGSGCTTGEPSSYISFTRFLAPS